MNSLPLIQDGLDEWLESMRQQRGLPSLSAAVAVDREVVWKGACGLAAEEPHRPAHPDMVYPIGSITKVFVVTMLMQLVEQGVVALEDPITKYIPEYQVISPFPGTPTASLRQLAAHTAGLPRDAAINFPMNQSLADWEFSDGRAPLHWYAPAEAVLDSLKTVALELPPDTAKRYSNLGIMLLGIALERACGQNIRQYIAEHIFAPWGMHSAGFLDEEYAWDDRFPTGYGRSSRSGALFPAPRWQLGGAIYTGGIYMTAADLARFCAAFLSAGDAGSPSPILSANSVRRMIHPDAMGDTNLGWWKGWHAGHANYGHAGAHVGFIAAVLFVPVLKLSVAVQTNRWNPIFDTNDSTEVARELLSHLTPRVEQSRPPFDPASVDLGRYTGSYRLPGEYAAADVDTREGLLRIALRGREADAMSFVPVGPGQFGPPGTNFPAITFQEDSSGKIASFDYALFRFQKRD